MSNLILANFPLNIFIIQHSDWRTVDPTPAGWLAPRRDALIRWRALFEPCELVRSSQGWRPSSSVRSDGASLVLATFAETKVARLPGRNPASSRMFRFLTSLLFAIMP